MWIKRTATSRCEKEFDDCERKSAADGGTGALDGSGAIFCKNSLIFWEMIEKSEEI